MAISAATALAIGALFQPIPAMAAPTTPPPPTAPATPAGGSATGAASVPDSGARPVQLGDLVLPGRPAGTPSAYTPAATLPGTPVSPAVQRVERGRAEIAQLGDQLIRIGQDRDIAQAQVTTARLKITEAQAAITQARADVDEAAETAMQQAAAMPPGSLDVELRDLEALSRLQRGDVPPDQGAARRLKAAQSNLQAATAEERTASQQFSTLSAQYTRLNTQITTKQAALQRLERTNAAELNAAETTETAADQQLGADYLAGESDGRSADPRSLQALQFALAQRGDPYVWSEEGPDQYDCSGLMFAAYRSVGFPLVRVSRDQYYQTRNKVVDRYSLLPGDLLFFSSSNSWTGIHHVAMYAGNGMMVEAPRSGLNVRLVPVRWSRLFQATRIFGSVEGGAKAPDLGSPDPEEPGTVRPSPSKTSPTPKPSGTTSRPTDPKPSSTTTPPTDPKPSSTTTPPTDPKPSGTTTPPTDPKPSSTTTPPTDPKPSSTTTLPPTTPTPGATTTSPASGEGSGAPSGSASSSRATSSGGASSSDSSPAKQSPSSTAKASSSSTAKQSSSSTAKASSSSTAKASSSSTAEKPSESAPSGD